MKMTRKIEAEVLRSFNSDDIGLASSTSFGAPGGIGNQEPRTIDDIPNVPAIAAEGISAGEGSEIIVPKPQDHASLRPLEPAGEKRIDGASVTEDVVDAPVTMRAISPEKGNEITFADPQHHTSPSPWKTATEEGVGGHSAAEHVDVPTTTAEAIPSVEGSGTAITDPQHHASPSPLETATEEAVDGNSATERILDAPTATAGTISPGEGRDIIAPDPQDTALPSLLRTIWEKVIEGLKPEDRNRLNFNELDNLKTPAEFLQDFEDKRQKLENKKDKTSRDAANFFSSNMEKFMEIWVIAVQHSMQPVPVAWIMFRFLLQIILNTYYKSGIMRNLLSDVKNISCILTRCAVYEELYTDGTAKSVQNLFNRISELYTAILLYCCHYKRYYRWNPKMLRSGAAVGSNTAGFLPLMEDIKKQETSVEHAARAAADQLQVTLAATDEKINFEQKKATADLRNLLQSMKQEVVGEFQNICKKLTGAERTMILSWLSEVTFGEHHALIRSGRQAKTGCWLFDKENYIEWRQRTSSAILWLCGVVGAGKTTLTSLVIDTIEATMSTKDALAYIYCMDGENGRDPELIMNNIVKQLSLMAPEGFLPEPVLSAYNKQKKDGLKFGRLSLDKSKELILELSKAFEQTTVIIDALDECNTETRTQLVGALKDLRSSAGGLKIFFTSRDDDEISFALGNEPDVYIQQCDNSSDIESFIQAEVEKYISENKLLGPSLKPDLKQLIIKTLIDGADGMFQWVRLQIDNISREKSESGIENALKVLPKGLDATYSVIWDRIDSHSLNNRLLAKRVLQWITCARSPLTWKDILDAVSVEPMEWTRMPNHDGVTVTEILAACQGLVVMNKKLGVFRPEHFSVTEFLQKRLILSEAHTTAAEVCLTLLCWENHAKANSQNGNNILDNHALANYAINNWVEHFRLSGVGSDTLTKLWREFLKPSAAYDAWLLSASQRHLLLRTESAQRQLTPLWIVCYYQLWDILEEILSARSDYNICNQTGKTPLHLLAGYNYDVGLRLLQEKEGVDVNRRDHSGNTPLHDSAQAGHELAITLLLTWNDVDLNSRNNDGNTPLHVATQAGHDAIVELLLAQEGADPNSKDIGGRTPLYVATQAGNEGMVELLLARQDVDPNLKDECGKTTLHAAVRAGHDAIVKLLLAREDVDLNSEDESGNTILHFAAQAGHEAVVELLLAQEGVDPTSKDNGGRTPLYFATQAGNEGVVKLLLAHKDVDPNLKYECDKTILHTAAQAGHDAIVKLLLARKGVVDPNCRDESGNTPLHFAAQAGHEAVVEVLLGRKDVDPSLKDECGKTPLHAAAQEGQFPVSGFAFAGSRNGHAAVVKLLLVRKDVDPNSRDHDDNTPLYGAAQAGHEAAVELLLARKDVDPNSKGKYGNTPLHAAAQEWKFSTFEFGAAGARNRHTAVVKLLLARKDVNPNSKDHDGNTPLHVAAWGGHEAIVNLLLARGDVYRNAKGECGKTPLHAAVQERQFSMSAFALVRSRNGCKAVVKLLLAHEYVNPNLKDDDGNTPLHVAVREGQEAMVDLLLARKDVDPNSKDISGNSPLYVAAQVGQEAVVGLLLARGDVDPNFKASDSKTPLHAAAQEWQFSMFEFDLASTRNGRIATVKLLLTRDDVDPNSKDNDCSTPLHVAAQAGNDAMVKLLLAREDIDPNSKDDYGNTPLHSAARAGHEAVTELLLARKDVDPNLQDQCGKTPLHAAVQEAKSWNGRIAVVNLLLARGDVDPNSKDNDCNTPLHIAVWERHEVVVKLLLERKDLDPNPKDNFDDTPIKIAARKDDLSTVNLLAKAMAVKEQQSSAENTEV